MCILLIGIPSLKILTLTLKFRKTRGKIKFVPDSKAYTYCPATWPVWRSQRNRWAHGQFQTLSKNKNILKSKFPLKDKVSFIDMFFLDVIISLIFPVGLAVLGVISIVMFMGDNLHVLIYPLASGNVRLSDIGDMLSLFSRYCILATMEMLNSFTLHL